MLIFECRFIFISSFLNKSLSIPSCSATGLLSAGALVNLVEHGLVLWAQLEVSHWLVVGVGRSLATEGLLNVSLVVDEPLDVGGHDLERYQVGFARGASWRGEDVLNEL